MRNISIKPLPLEAVADHERLQITDPLVTGINGDNLASGEDLVLGADPLAGIENNQSFDQGQSGLSSLSESVDPFDFDSLDPLLEGPRDHVSASPDAAVVGDLNAIGFLPNDGNFAFVPGEGDSLAPSQQFSADHGLDPDENPNSDSFKPFSHETSYSVHSEGDFHGFSPTSPSNDGTGADPTVSGQASPDGGDSGIASLGDAFAAKGGNPGKPGDGGGGGGGGTGDSGVLSDYFSGSDDGDSGYDIWIDFKGSGWTVELQNAFTFAADYFTSIITDDIGGGGLYRGKTIDDLYVTAELKSIDGSGGVLGQAGPSATWTANDLTAAGVMQFDIADATDYQALGLWDDIVTHEMMHVLGFGSLWNYGDHVGLVTGNEYTGQYALSAYQETNPTAAFIPVEDGGGSGTAGSHWDEQALDNELMTGYINNDGDPSTNDDNYLSKFSVMALADLGYTVDYHDYPYDDGVNLTA